MKTKCRIDVYFYFLCVLRQVDLGDGSSVSLVDVTASRATDVWVKAVYFVLFSIDFSSDF